MTRQIPLKRRTPGPIGVEDRVGARRPLERRLEVTHPDETRRQEGRELLSMCSINSHAPRLFDSALAVAKNRVGARRTDQSDTNKIRDEVGLPLQDVIELP